MASGGKREQQATELIIIELLRLPSTPATSARPSLLSLYRQSSEPRPRPRSHRPWPRRGALRRGRRCSPGTSSSRSPSRGEGLVILRALLLILRLLLRLRRALLLSPTKDRRTTRTKKSEQAPGAKTATGARPRPPGLPLLLLLLRLSPLERRRQRRAAATTRGPPGGSGSRRLRPRGPRGT